MRGKLGSLEGLHGETGRSSPIQSPERQWAHMRAVGPRAQGRDCRLTFLSQRALCLSFPRCKISSNKTSLHMIQREKHIQILRFEMLCNCKVSSFNK